MRQPELAHKKRNAQIVAKQNHFANILTASTQKKSTYVFIKKRYLPGVSIFIRFCLAFLFYHIIIIFVNKNYNKKKNGSANAPILSYIIKLVLFLGLLYLVKLFVHCKELFLGEVNVSHTHHRCKAKDCEAAHHFHKAAPC